MFAVIKLAGTQHLVQKGDVIVVNRLAHNVNDQVTITDVLSRGDDSNMQVGSPLVEGASVTAKVLEHNKAKKVIIFKKLRRHNHRRKKGFRQSITKLEITDIK